MRGIFHSPGRARLLAAGALDDAEQAAEWKHLENCGPCREEFEGTRGLLQALSHDPLRRAVPGVDVDRLASSVLARSRARKATGRATLIPALLSLAAVLLALVGPAAAPVRPVVSEEALDRLERNLAREQTARYLTAAGALLVSVAAEVPHCRKTAGNLDISDEAETSRALLARRALLPEAAAPPARAVLQDVEQVLRDVASLDPCVRPADLETIHREIREKRLLMKIDLVTQELQG